MGLPPFGIVLGCLKCLGDCLVDDLQCTHAVLQCMGLFIFISPAINFIHINIYSKIKTI